VGLPAPVENIDYFRIPDDRSQERRLPGMPFGTRGGTKIAYHFAADGEYVIAAELARDLNESLPLYAEPQQLEIAIDGERVALFTLPGVPRASGDGAGSGLADSAISQIRSPFRISRQERAARNRADEDWNVRVPVRAGKRDVTVTFLAKTAALDETARLPFLRPYPAGVNIPETRTGAYLRSIEISGPYRIHAEALAAPGGAPDRGARGGASGDASPGDTSPGRALPGALPGDAWRGRASSSPSRERIFVCRPQSGDGRAAGDACAETILTRLARRAYRRPVTDHDVAALLDFYAQGRDEGGFDAGIALALKRLLVSPEFLFRVERDPEGLPPGTPYQITPVELASRLSFFLWSSIPDDELLAAAVDGRLDDDGEIEAQVRRMLADPKAGAFVENFAGQWLFLRNLDATVPVQSYFPDFDDTLRQALRRETELFFGSIVREDRSALDLLRADYTFLNERLAKHYGVPGIKGARFRRVQLAADDPRRGLLGHGSILAVTSYPDRTSPVVRGKWILENLLGTPPPAPPPDVPGLVATDGAGTPLSMRERLAAHRSNPNCAACHALMDPLGFALENFDAIGRWRTVGDAGEPIDASGELPDGTPFEGIDGLRRALLSSDLFLQTMTEKLMTYALGRGIEHYDLPTVRRIVREAGRQDDRFSAFVLGVVDSPAFRMRRTAAEESG
ncbi:MAG: DUF1592 domain-containing protein, partial [Gammaproteobacteria bacterium]|nr:DUF1592 domain-containing protein [Gammaproteobacteria bacterium]